MSRFGRRFHFTIAVIILLVCLVWSALTILVVYRWHTAHGELGLITAPAILLFGAVVEFKFYYEERNEPDSSLDVTDEINETLLSTRPRTAVAIVVTSYMLVLAVRGALGQGHNDSGRLLLNSFFGLHGWSLIAVNVAFYAYICWLAFCFIRASAGRERVFLVAWFIDVLLWPVKAMWPEWDMAAQFVSSIALGVAVGAAVSLLFKPPEVHSANPGAGNG